MNTQFNYSPRFHSEQIQQNDTHHTHRAQLHHCANCDIEFPWTATIVQGKTYCCRGCAAGGPCSCDYSQYRSVTISGVIHYDSEQEQ